MLNVTVTETAVITCNYVGILKDGCWNAWSTTAQTLDDTI